MQDEHQTQDEANREEGMEGPQEKLPAEAEGGEPTRSRPTFRPRCDIVETDEGLVILADMPGAKADTLDVSIERRELTIRAEVEDHAPEGMDLALREYRVGDWERRFRIPVEIDADRIEAKLRDGVLTLTLPRAEEAQARRVEVGAG
ncbi:HSP20 family molecular chaperone IbpA [Hasllibacter halocynthiae]|uniref:HSP20 family molecular chaperone IbpA n=1 Tax=Hasllibacter halocynthiae TaxID=595589 RepID=A0A2T0X1K4_9RHOB|nr:Hsp20/alpha crystallin family protein [Hasllibacter halocynthiae]PRY92833.1 HSP20 family molecular chaperone IbpA [Hasllibacter halocynthiae]